MNHDDSESVNRAFASGHLTVFVRTGRLMRIRRLCNDVEHLCCRLLHGLDVSGNLAVLAELDSEECGRTDVEMSTELWKKAEEITQHARDFHQAEHP